MPHVSHIGLRDWGLAVDDVLHARDLSLVWSADDHRDGITYEVRGRSLFPSFHPLVVQHKGNRKFRRWMSLSNHYSDLKRRSKKWITQTIIAQETPIEGTISAFDRSISGSSALPYIDHGSRRYFCHRVARLTESSVDQMQRLSPKI